jgi:hypothetical protein
MLAATTIEAHARLQRRCLSNMVAVWCFEAKGCIERATIYISTRIVGVLCAEKLS